MQLSAMLVIVAVLAALRVWSSIIALGVFFIVWVVVDLIRIRKRDEQDKALTRDEPSDGAVPRS